MRVLLKKQKVQIYYFDFSEKSDGLCVYLPCFLLIDVSYQLCACEIDSLLVNTF